jgi:hypothetical protein
MVNAKLGNRHFALIGSEIQPVDIHADCKSTFSADCRIERADFVDRHAHTAIITAMSETDYSARDR